LFTAASSSFSNPIIRSGEDCRHFNFNSYSGIALIKHARYYWLLLAESHLTRRLFGGMLQRIATLPSPAG
jgi:hypothetical protein